MNCLVYSFSDAFGLSKDLLGGKGFGLVQMQNMGLPVPPGFIITTEACREYYENNKAISENLKNQILNQILNLEKITNKKLYRKNEKSDTVPLFLSARSGAKVSMPGMMDTILNIGITDESHKFLMVNTADLQFANSVYLRFLQMFADVYAGINKDDFCKAYESSNSFEEKVKKAKEYYKKVFGKEFPEDPYEQLFLAIEAVFKSFNNERAKYYRKINNIPEDSGTAVTIQMMVFGNYKENSGTGVAFTRNPSNGEKKFFGEYLINAQGEDVVAGLRTPSSIENLKNEMPDVYKQFEDSANKLENHFSDMQDIEFTIEKGKLYILQTRSAKRSPEAAVKIALDLAKEGKISERESLNYVSNSQIQGLLHSKFNLEALKNAKIICKGLPASPGAAVGKAVFDSKKAQKYHENNEKIILIRQETSPEDIESMAISEGVLTVHGGMTSHAAIVARGMGKCCVSGCEDILINNNSFICNKNKININEGDYISIDGTSGNVYLGKIELENLKFSDNFLKFLKVAKKYGKIKVMANADSPKSVQDAVLMGADGIGLCRTEHMFFEKDRINFMREMIISQTLEERQKALEKLFEFQKKDFLNMFVSANGISVTVRLLDPPLHEFLPKNNQEFENLAQDLKINKKYIEDIAKNLYEFNPMMGHRGCRLLISYPEIAEMQVKAIISAAIEASKKINKLITPEIMVPLVGDVNEIKFLKKIIINIADKIIKQNNFKINYKIGTMIEVPRASFMADKIASEVDFFSFGTNDLTQMTFGFSRDDAQKFLKKYYENNIYNFDPFMNIDTIGVGELMKIAIKLGRQANKNLKIGVCGEHAGDSKSIEFFKTLDIDYISCSPFRVPGAILAASR